MRLSSLFGQVFISHLAEIGLITFLFLCFQYCGIKHNYYKAMEEERADPYVKERGSEPINCSLVSTVVDDEPYDIVAAYIKESPMSNCCTVEGGKVTKWRVPANGRVQLRDRSGSIFCYDNTKMALDR